MVYLMSRKTRKTVSKTLIRKKEEDDACISSNSNSSTRNLIQFHLIY